jgi:hypothetical protein
MIEREAQEEEGNVRHTLAALDNKQFYRFVTFYLIYCLVYSRKENRPRASEKEM